MNVVANIKSFQLFAVVFLRMAHSCVSDSEVNCLVIFEGSYKVGLSTLS